MKIRKTTALIFYWIAAIVCVAMILISLEYSFAKALFMAVLFLPGAVVAKFFFSQIRWDASGKTILNCVYLFGSIAVMEFLLVVFGHWFLEYIEQQIPVYCCGIGVADILVNPVFVAVIIFLILAGETLISQRFKQEKEDTTISFTSDRHKIILDREEIIYIESNDSEVWINATQDRRFRNKTGITQWEHLLGEDFIRVHRSYLVRKNAVQEVSYDQITLTCGAIVPVSRKYRDCVNGLQNNGNERRS